MSPVFGLPEHRLLSHTVMFALSCLSNIENIGEVIMTEDLDLEVFRLPSGSSPEICSSTPATIQGLSARSRASSQKRQHRIPRQQGLFIKGPIPLAWLDGVLKIPGAAVLKTALALWFRSGLEKTSTIRFTSKMMRRFMISPKSATRALEQMQASGLVRVHHRPGCCRDVEILNVKAELITDASAD